MTEIEVKIGLCSDGKPHVEARQTWPNGVSLSGHDLMGYDHLALMMPHGYRIEARQP